MRLECTGDVLFLALVSMIQVTRPTLLKPADGGFDVDVSPLLHQKDLNEDERLVLRIYGVLSASTDKPKLAIDLTPAEATRLDRALALVQSARSWPPDALALTSTLRERLQH